MTLPSKLIIFFFIPNFFSPSATLCYLSFQPHYIARCTGIAVYVRDSLFNYIKCKQNYRYLSYFAMEKISGRLIQTMGVCQANRESQIFRAEYCFCIGISLPNGLIVFPIVQSLRMKKSKNEEKEGKGGKERRGKVCPPTWGTWSEFLFWMTNRDFILFHERLENIAGNIQVLCRQ